MEKNRTGFRLMDYSDPKDAAWVLEQLGGEELLKTEYPHLYAAFLRTKQAHMLRRRQNEATTDGLSTCAFTDDLSFQPATSTTGTGAPVEINGTLSGNTWLQPHGTWVRAWVNLDVKDVTENINLESYSEMLNNTSFYSRELEHTFIHEEILGDKVISNHIDFQGVCPDGQTESGYSNSAAHLFEGSYAPVLYLAVEHPKSEKGNNPIIVLYNRPPDTKESADYDYPDNKALPDNPHKVNTLLPVKVQITFNEHVQPLEFDVKNSTTPPTLLYKNKGVVRYFTPDNPEKDYNERVQKLAKSFSVSKENPHVAVMDFGENWNKILDISAYTAENRGVIYLNFGFRVKCKWDDGAVKSISILIKSVDKEKLGDNKYYESWNANQVLVPPIYIKWGCFAQDTLFRMADGSEQKGGSIQKGAQLISADGRMLQVSEVYRGHEEYLYTLRTENGKELRLTTGHPVATDSGVCRVEQLQPGDVVLCENGETDIVKFVYEAEYGGEICNFEFEDCPNGVLLLANGIQAGDFAMQNQNLNVEIPAPQASQEALDAAADLERLVKHLNKLRGGSR